MMALTTGKTPLNDDLIDDLQFHNEDVCSIHFVRVATAHQGQVGHTITQLEVVCMNCQEVLMIVPNVTPS